MLRQQIRSAQKRTPRLGRSRIYKIHNIGLLMKSQMQSAMSRLLSSLWYLCRTTNFLSNTRLVRGCFALLLTAVAAGVFTLSAKATETVIAVKLDPNTGTNFPGLSGDE